MPQDDVEEIARTVMHEGYALYPYRATAIKNRYRWTIGTVYPRVYSVATGGHEPCALESQCLIEVPRFSVVRASLRFLQAGLGGEGADNELPPALERRVDLSLRIGECGQASLKESGFHIPGDAAAPGNARDGCVLRGMFSLAAHQVAASIWRLTIRVTNDSEMPGVAGDRRDAESRLLAGVHVVLSAESGRFVSLIDPPALIQSHADACRQQGLWPVLVGDPEKRDSLLAAPIIFEDYPRIAPESAGDLFDATEIDELLSLRIRTLTQEEKIQARRDPRVASLIERADAMTPEGLGRLHGTWRPKAVPANRKAPGLAVGDRVRLRPRRSADAMDMMLAGRLATIVAIEEDFEGRRYFAVAIDDDPGRDLGFAGRIGHRFFYEPDEVQGAM